MKKNKISIKLVIFLFILIIVFFTSIYTLQKADYVVSQNVLLGVIIGLLVFTIIGFIAIIKICNKKELKPEKALLFILPIFCVLLFIAIPVSTGHDERLHWYRAFEISQGQLVTPVYKNDRVSLAELPEGINKISKQVDGKLKYLDNMEMLNEKLNYEESMLISNQYSAVYCFIQYIPEVIGILIGRIITQVPILIAYCARFINMIVCIGIMYFAVKIIPFGKNVLLLLSIIPIAIETFSTISPDGLTIAICALFIAYTLYVAFDKNKKCGTKETVILTVIGIIVSLCKIVYMPLLFLVLIIPKEKFKSKKDRITSLALIITIGVICNLVWLAFGSMILFNTNANTYLGSTENGAMIKIISLLKNPIEYIQKLFYTLGVNGNQYFLSLFGGQLEWEENIKIEIIPYVVCGIAAFATISDEKLKNSLNRFQKIIIFLIIFVIVLLIFTSLYIQWSDNDLLYIDGVQGRYFLPILPLILFLVGGLKIKSSYSNLAVTKLICISSIIIQLYTVTAILAEHL